MDAWNEGKASNFISQAPKNSRRSGDEEFHFEPRGATSSLQVGTAKFCLHAIQSVFLMVSITFDLDCSSPGTAPSDQEGVLDCRHCLPGRQRTRPRPDFKACGEATHLAGAHHPLDCKGRICLLMFEVRRILTFLLQSGPRLTCMQRGTPFWRRGDFPRRSSRNCGKQLQDFCRFSGEIVGLGPTCEITASVSLSDASAQ